MSRRHGRSSTRVLNWPRRATMLVAGVVLIGRSLAAQPTGGAGGGTLGSSFDGQQFSYGKGPRSTGTEYRIWLLLPRSGHLLSPDLFSYQATFQPTFLWQLRSGIPEAQRLRQFNYSLSATALATGPLGLSVAGTNTSATSSGGAGSLRDFSLKHRNASVWLRFRPLPVQFTVNRQDNDETWRNPGSAPLRNATIQRTYRVSATNSKLAIQAQRFEYDDRLRAADYSATSFSAVHTLRWGRGSRLESGYTRSDQAGLFLLRRREWTERLELYHSRAVKTSYFFSRYANGSSQQPSIHNNFGGTATVIASRHLTVGLLANRQGTSRGDTRDMITFLAPRIGVSAGSRRAGYFNGSALVGWEGRRLVGATGTVPVIDEAHPVSASRTVVLDQLDVEPGSVVVRNFDGTLVYLEGTDYQVVAAGRITQIGVLATGRIRVGDQLLLNYRYTAEADGSTDGIRADLSLAVGRGGLSLIHQQSLRQSSRPAALDPLFPLGSPNDFADRRTSFSYRASGKRGTLETTAGIRSRERGGSLVTETELGLSLLPPRIGAVDGALAIGWSEARTDSRRQRGLTASGSLAWPLGPGLTFRLTGEATRLRFSDSGRFRYFDSKMNVSWTYGRLTVDWEVDWYRQTAPLVRSTTRVAARLVRSL